MHPRCRHIVLALLLSMLPLPAAADVEIDGLESPLAGNVRQYLGELPDCDAAPIAIRRYAQGLDERVRPGLEAYGYYAAELEASVELDGECWTVTLAVAPGQPVRIRDVTLTLSGAAERDPDFERLFDTFPLPPGTALRHEQYEQFKRRVESLAREHGYVDGRFEQQRLDVYVDEGVADITLRYDSGPRFGFGDVEMESDALARDVLRSFLPFSEGQAYDGALIARLQRDLLASEYFMEPRVTPRFDAAQNERIPIRIELERADTLESSVGAGFSTDDGPRFRYSRNNWLRNARGHQLHTDLLLAYVRQNLNLEYRIPEGNPQRDWRSWRFAVEREDIEAGQSAKARVGLRRTRVRPAGTVTRFVDVLFERDRLSDGDRSTTMLMPGISWSRSYRDDLVRPREGYRLSAVLSSGLGLSTPFLQLDFRGKWITAMPWDARLIVRGRVGTLVEDGAFDVVPLSSRFFAGGDSSVRGYEFESLGPRNEEGAVIGGNRLLEASVEYEHAVREQWSVAVFADAGNAFFDTDFEPQVGAGIGARWFSPVGPIRFDVAWPLDGTDRSPRLHISLGPDL